MPLIMRLDADTKAATSKIKAASKSAGASVKKLEKQSVSSASKMKTAFSSLGPVIGALGFAVVLKGLKSLVTETITFRDEIAKFSKATGTSVEFLSGMGFAAERSGANVDSMGKAFGRLARNMSDASRGLITPLLAFETLGIEVKDTEGNLKNIEDVLPEIADGFKNLTDNTRKAALAQELFGRAGVELVPLLEEGSEGIKALTDEGERFGIVFGEKAAKEAEDAADAITNFNTAITAMGQNIASNALPSLTAMANNIANVIAAAGDPEGKFGKFINQLKSGFVPADFEQEIERLKTLKRLLEEPVSPPTVPVAAETALEQLENFDVASFVEDVRLMEQAIAGLGLGIEEIVPKGLKFKDAFATENLDLNARNLADMFQEGAKATEDMREETEETGVGMAIAANAAGQFAQNMARALATGQDLGNVIKSFIINLGLSFLPGGSNFKGFQGGGIAPGGFVPSLVGEGGGAPEIVQSASPIRVTPLNQVTNNSNQIFNVNFTNVTISDFDLLTDIGPRLSQLISAGQLDFTATTIR